jgi:hypothetical protein
MHIIKTILLGVFFALGSLNVQAALMLDQNQTIHDSTSYRVASDRALAQTFQVTFDGWLDRFLIQTGGTADQLAPATLSVYSTDGGGKPNTQLWSQTFPNLSSGWFEVNPTGLSVTQGVLYAIVLTSTDNTIGNPDDKWLASSTGNVYAAGNFYQNIGSGWENLGLENADATFQTYISPIPETSSVFLGSLGMFFLLRRRR